MTENLLENGEFMRDPGRGTLARADSDAVLTPAAPWAVWSESAAGETVTDLVPPGAAGEPGALRVRTRAGRGGVRQRLALADQAPVAAGAWVLVRRGGVSLRLESGTPQQTAADSTVVNSWQFLRIDVADASPDSVVTIDGESESEFLVAGAHCARIDHPDDEARHSTALPPPVMQGTIVGTITTHGSAVSFGTVVVSARRLRADLPIAQAVPGPDGRFAVSYDWIGERIPALVVKLVDASGSVLTQAPVLVDAPREAVVDLVLGGSEGPQSELVRLLNAVTSVLDGVAAGDLDVDDVDDLAEATAQDPSHLFALIRASRVAGETDANTDVLYALMRTAGWPQKLDGGRWSSQAFAAAVKSAVAAGVVPPAAVDGVETTEANLRRSAVEKLVGDPTTGRLLELALPDLDIRRAIVRQYLEHEGPDAELWERFASDATIATAGDDLRYGVRLAELTNHDLALIGELFRRRRTGDSVTLQELAGYDESDWAILLGLDATGTRRVATLVRTFERAFPSAAFNRRAIRDQDGDPEVVDFLRANLDVDLGVADLDAFSDAPAGLKAIQRLFKVSARYDDVTALHGTGYRSAAAIVRTGRAAFVRRHGDALGGREAAGVVFERATRISLAASGIYLEHGPSARAGLPRVLENPALPDWGTLFPADRLSFAGVEEWRSVFSPAAYLTDLLAFLDGHPSAVSGSTALDELLDRRPDLQSLLLSRRNTEVLVPYIDLVNELLESVVLGHAASAPWLIGYPDPDPGALPPGSTQTTGGEGWQWTTDPAVPRSTITGCHASPASPGEHHHGFQDATTSMSVAPGDQLVTWVYLDPANPPDEMMVEWVAGADRDHRAYWTGLPRNVPGIAVGDDGTPSRHPMGELPATGRWTRLAVPASAIGLENRVVTGMRFIVYTAAGWRSTNASGGAWWGSAGTAANAPPVETVGTAEQLSTQPQVIAAAAYEPLAAAVYPHQALPFDLGVEAVRVAFTQLGISRAQVMEVLHRGSRTDALLDVEISAERLGLTPHERAIVTGSDGHAEHEHWGMTADPAHPDQWFEDLLSAREFLRRSGLTLDQMRAPPGVIMSYGLGLGLADPHDPSSLKVIGLSLATLRYLRRFLRLWRKLGWADGDLERIIRALGPADPDPREPRHSLLDPLLVTLALMDRLTAMIGVAPSTTMAWWTSKLDGRGYVDPGTYPPDGPLSASQSPYARLFLREHAGHVNPAFRLSAEGDELADPSQSVESQLPDLLAALELGAADVALLAGSDLTGLPDGPPAPLSDLRLTLGNISALYRCATFAKATGLTAGEFLTLRRLSVIDPFDPDRPDATVQLVEALADIRGSRASPADLQWLLGHVNGPGQRVVPTEPQVSALLGDLQAGLVAIRDSHRPGPDPAGQVTLSELSGLPGAHSGIAAVGALNGTAATAQPLTATPVDVDGRSSGLLTYDPVTKELTFTAGAMTTAQQAELQALSSDAGFHTALDALFTTSRQPVALLLDELQLTSPTVTELIDQLAEPSARFGALLPKVAEKAWRGLGRLLVRDKIATAAGIEPELCSQLIGGWLHVTDASGGRQSAIDALLALADGQAVEKHGPARDAAVKCSKVGQVVGALNLTRSEVAHAFEVGRRHGWLDLDALPVRPAEADFSGWLRLARYVALRTTLDDWTGTLVAVFAAADGFTGSAPEPALNAALAELADAFGWPVDTLSDAVEALGLTYPADFVSEVALGRLKAVIDAADTVGATVAQLQTLARNPLSGTDGLASWQLLAAKYDAASWVAVGAALQDVIRDRRRDALVAYVEAHPANLGLGEDEIDGGRLLERLLVDVEMGACRSSSRLELAINGVQLFVQRCLLGLEPRIELDADDVSEWLWLGAYQTWVANRRVFVYPENWLDPTLRSDVTEQFTQLQRRLLQTDLTSDAAETEIVDYLRALDEIANMEPAAVLRDLSLSRAASTDGSGNPIETVTLRLGDTHVVSRTRSTPHHYYHRVRSALHLWTPWERVNVDIDADNLLPAILNGQLYLFWPQFLDSAPDDLSTPGKPPVRSRVLSLAWTRLHQGQWTSRQVSTTTLDQGADTYDLALSDLFLSGDPTQAFYTSAAYQIGPRWYLGPWRGDPTSWTVVPRSDLVFAPGSLTVTVPQVSSGDPEVLYPPQIGTGGGLGAGTWYYVLTRLGAGSSGEETARSNEVAVELTPMFGKIIFSWSKPTGWSSSYRLYRGSSAGQEHEYFDIVPDPSSATVTFTDDGSQQPSGRGTPPVSPWWETTPPHPGATPSFQAFALEQTAGLTAGLLGLSADPAAGWTGASVTALARVDTATRVTASPTQTAGVVPSDAVGFVPVLGLATELGERSFFVVQDPDLTIVKASQPASDGVTPGSLSVAIAHALDSRDAGADRSATLLDSGADAIRVRFSPTYHPWVKLLLSELSAAGLPRLLRRDLQLDPDAYVQPPVPTFDFEQYGPTAAVADPYPSDAIDFTFDGAYSTYNWELFFQIPLLIARNLITNRRFEDARRWLHFIFDPTDASSAPAPQRYWQTAPLFSASGAAPDPSIAGLLDLLADPTADPTARAAAERQVDVWRHRPFDPDVLARLRLSAYQKSVVMTYLDNLIAWGDDLFSQGTAETITQATQLYDIAAQLLGPRPDLGAVGRTPQPYSFRELRGTLDSFSDPLVEVENRLAMWTTEPQMPPSYEPAPVATLTPLLLFGIPVNDKLVGYWSILEDRLYKVNHCLDIRGQLATVPEFGPPVDPGRAVGAFGTAYADGALAVALPQYRFGTLAQKAAELCGDVKSLGAALLAAMEKRDAETLARVRSAQEVHLLQTTRDIKQRQVDETSQAITALHRSHAVTKARFDYYGTRPFLNTQESQQLSHLETAALLQTLGQGFEVLGAALALIPQVDLGLAGAGGSPLVNASFGGQQLSGVTQIFSRLFSMLASVENHRGTMAGLMGGHFRRRDDWTLQAGQADLELKQIDAQLAGAEIRQDIARKELTEHDTRTADAGVVDAFLVTKFSNAELYDWMVSQVSTVYFQAYQLALEMARRAERAFQHELGAYDAHFIRPGYWNGLSRGLLAGEQLSHDLRRMEAVYLEANRREYELTKHVSLALTDPMALLRLIEVGECFVELPETLFDLDYPGHYLRRLKSVAVTIPCVTGPYTSVNCTLTLLQNSVRTDADASAPYPRQSTKDGRFRDQLAGAQTIATSNARSDTGLFETNLHDERLLPFEGAGAISRWHVTLPLDTNQFRRETLTDLVLHIRYTARDGGQALTDAVRAQVVAGAHDSGTRLLTIRRDQPDAWARFQAWATAATAPLDLTLAVTRTLLPAQAPADAKIARLQLIVVTQATLPAPAPTIGFQAPAAASATTAELVVNKALANLPQAVAAYDVRQPFGDWTVTFPPAVAALAAEDMIVLVDYAT